MRFIPTGNYSRMVSCPTWHRCVSYRQETICVWFPVRHVTDVLHTGRKLFAYGFLLDMASLCFMTTGNYLRRVSYPTWHCCVSYRQETICVWFPIRLEANAFNTDRKLFAKGFLFSLGRMCFIPTGNYSRMVSYSAWDRCVSYRQETICVWFPVRLGASVFHTDRKLFAKGFLSDLALLCFIPTGNYSRMVSYPAWHHGISYRQETVCVWFPIRLGTSTFHIGRKLPGEEISRLRFAALEMTERRGAMVFHAHRKLSHCPTISLAHQPTTPYPNSSSGRILFFPSSMVKTEARSFLE